MEKEQDQIISCLVNIVSKSLRGAIYNVIISSIRRRQLSDGNSIRKLPNLPVAPSTDAFHPLLLFSSPSPGALFFSFYDDSADPFGSFRSVDDSFLPRSTFLASLSRRLQSTVMFCGDQLQREAKQRQKKKREKNRIEEEEEEEPAALGRPKTEREREKPLWIG